MKLLRESQAQVRVEVSGLGFSQGSGFRVSGLGFRVSFLGFRVLIAPFEGNKIYIYIYIHICIYI